MLALRACDVRAASAASPALRGARRSRAPSASASARRGARRRPPSRSSSRRAPPGAPPVFVRVSSPSSHRLSPVATPASDSDEPGPSRGGEDEPDRDEDGLYIGTYSNFFTDPDQIKGVVIFSAFLAAFGSLGNIGASILLPILYGQPIQTCVQGILFGCCCPP